MNRQDLTHLKEQYIEMRIDMKRGYGVHGYKRSVSKYRIESAHRMVDDMASFTNNTFRVDVIRQLTEIMGFRFAVDLKSGLKHALSISTPVQFAALLDVIKAESGVDPKKFGNHRPKLV